MSGCETDWNVFLKTLIISSSKIVETSSELISTSSELISTGSELIRIIAELLIISVFKKRKHRYRVRWNLGKGCPKRSVLIFNSVMSFGKIHRVFMRGYQRGDTWAHTGGKHMGLPRYILFPKCMPHSCKS